LKFFIKVKTGVELAHWKVDITVSYFRSKIAHPGHPLSGDDHFETVILLYNSNKLC